MMLKRAVLRSGLLVGLLLLAGMSAAPAKSPITIEAVDRPAVPLRAWVARIDLSDPRVRVRSVQAGDEPPTPGARWPTILQTVRHAAEREKLALAVNGDFFAVERTLDANGRPATRQYVAGKKGTALGNAVSGGVRWASSTRPVMMLVVGRDGAVSVTRGKDVPEGAAEVMSGNTLLVADGEVQPKEDPKAPRHPRTAAGVTADGKTLILLVVDGRSIRSRGASAFELATLMKEFGAHSALNLDGGGSTTLVARDETGTLKVINSPSDQSERPVANLLGVVVEEK